jgi:hypothetical protein
LLLVDPPDLGYHNLLNETEIFLLRFLKQEEEAVLIALVACYWVQLSFASSSSVLELGSSFVPFVVVSFGVDLGTSFGLPVEATFAFDLGPSSVLIAEASFV